MNKILVTGANGFVGTALCDTLNAHQIGFVPVVRTAYKTGQLAVGDLSGQTRWDDALAGCKVVIHLAARVHVMNDASRNALADFRSVNVDATVNLAKQAIASGVRRFIFVSSVKVNGECTPTAPFSAFDQPAPLDPYGVSKFEAEQALLSLSRASDLELVIVRPPLVYGPGVGANFLRLMHLVRIGVPLPLGAIDNRRSMVALDNLVNLLIACCDHPNAAGQTFLVSDDMDVSTTELLRMLARSLGKRSCLLPVPPSVIAFVAGLVGRSAEATRLLSSLQVDVTHTKTTLGWKPVIGVQEALDKTAAHYLAHR